jgi:hypothetical protein
MLGQETSGKGKKKTGFWPFELFASVCDALLVILIYNKPIKIFCSCMLKWSKKLARPFWDANALLRVVSVLLIFKNLLL